MFHVRHIPNTTSMTPARRLIGPPDVVVSTLHREDGSFIVVVILALLINYRPHGRHVELGSVCRRCNIDT